MEEAYDGLVELIYLEGDDTAGEEDFAARLRHDGHEQHVFLFMDLYLFDFEVGIGWMRLDFLYEHEGCLEKFVV